MPKTEDCSSCGLRTTGRSRITGRPLCSHCQARPLKTLTLASLARRPGSRPRVQQCRICLAEEPLKGGICKDRAACEKRQPPLIPLEEL